MKIHIISVGKIDKMHQALAEKYRKMINCSLTETEIVYSKKMPQEIIKQYEANLIIKKIPAYYSIIVLDETGKQHSSIEFSKLLQKHMIESQNICFIIGGAYGLDNLLKDQAKMMLSFSKMTIPHQFAKIFLLEQIYRAESIIKGHPYHK